MTLSCVSTKCTLQVFMKCLLCIRTVLSNVNTEVKKADKNPNSHKITNLGGQSMK